MSVCANKYEIVKSYRDLYRHALRAVQFSSPARYTVRTHLRLSFRRNAATAFNPRKIANTLLFLKYAAKERGFEHRLLKSLIHVWWWQEQTSRQKRDVKNFPPLQAQTRNEIVNSTFNHFTVTLALLNESMGMCLPEQVLHAEAIEKLDQWKQLRFFGERSQAAEQSS
ncbi:MAG: hypothetical protein L6R41_006951 [Letrouitia leprolyta]|nr:MAG: hypothetical protein L6R41_006951 [Letrouitia leprolyta]